ncbi:cold shock domain-containing protein [Pelagibacterium sp. H642]|uniref:cold-shock protein n=1 Tax=Pelagibacterium sp. H642 TaxID=1881069 RepID=UPI0028154B3B|nr:cold shock domain-containing protein [Pelagibacterium sp. H642]WMT92568.1 cold shock domain-containing protein [Pelagibacterium sp. H642]
MATGTVKFYDQSQGYGTIEPSDHGHDVHVPWEAIERAGWALLNVGQRLSYDVALNATGWPIAANLSVIH